MLEPPSSSRTRRRRAIALDLDWFHHRALLWPMKRVHAEIVPREDGFHVAIRSALWAGVPIQGEIDVALRPERHLDVRLESPEAPVSFALEPSARRRPAADVDPRRRAVGHPAGSTSAATQSGFQQRHTRARVRAVGANVRFDDVRLRARAGRSHRPARSTLDLSRDDAVPYALTATSRRAATSAR